jgi:integrase
MDKRTKGETDVSKKTANGLGTIDQLPSGLFRWRVSLATSTGKRVRLSSTAKTETLARKALVKAVTDNERGLLSAPDRTTVADFAQTWLERQTGLSTRTISTYKKEISYALEHIGTMKVRDVSAPHLKSLMTTLTARVMGKRDENGKPKKEDAETMHSCTLGKVLTRLRGIFREAVHDQIIYVNPCDGVKRPKMQTIESVGVVLDFDEKARFHELGEALHAAGACSLWPAIFTALSVKMWILRREFSVSNTRPSNRTKALNGARRQRRMLRAVKLKCPRACGPCSKSMKHIRPSSVQRPGVHGAIQARYSLPVWVGGSARTT